MSKIQLIAIVALIVLLPAALLASQLQVNLNSRANVDQTPVTPVTPITPPETSTPVQDTPTPVENPTETPISTPTLTMTPTTTPTPTATSTPTPPLVRGSFPAVADAYVRKSNTNRSYGTGSRMEVDGSPQEISYLKFDLSPLAGKTVELARLRLRITDSSSHTQTINRVDNTSWNESTLTYRNRPTLTGRVTQFQARREGSWTEIDVTAWAQGQTGRLTSLSIDQTGSNGITFSSRETANKPQLVISYR